MNIFKKFQVVVKSELEAMSGDGFLPKDVDVTRIVVEPPRDPSHGDMATNAALILAKQAGKNPREIGEELSKRLSQRAEVTNSNVAGPGFVNFKLKTTGWADCLKSVLQNGTAFGDSDYGQKHPVNIEYVSANPTGPLTAGHARGAVIGDALANLLIKAGFEVTKEYYINDAGAQVGKLAQSTYLRYREALGEDIGEIPDGYYPGEYLKDVGQALADQDGDKWLTASEEDYLPVCKKIVLEMMMGDIKKDLVDLGITFDVFTSEQSIVDKGTVEEAYQELVNKGLIYTGVLEPPKGKKLEDWEERPQTLFKSTEFGDDVDRPLKKSDGSWTYFSNDIAYHWDKYKRGGKTLINILGADHGGYVKRIKAAVEAVTGGQASVDCRLCQLVHMFDNGKPVRMSKRAGTFIKLRDIIDTVGADVVRFIMLTRRNDQTLEFDFAKVTDQSKDNPVFYVQYANARCHSVLKNGLKMWPDLDLSREALANVDLNLLSSEDELKIIRLMASWPRTVEAAAEAHEPHRIAFYLNELASEFHSFWNKGREDATLRFLIEDDLELSKARLALVKSITLVIASGLAVMGVQPIEEM